MTLRIDKPVVVISYGVNRRTGDDRFNCFMARTDLWVAANNYDGKSSGDSYRVLEQVKSKKLEVAGRRAALPYSNRRQSKIGGNQRRSRCERQPAVRSKGWANSSLNPAVKAAILQNDNFSATAHAMVGEVASMLREREGTICVAVCCSWGKHRSVALAQHLVEMMGPQVGDVPPRTPHPAPPHPRTPHPAPRTRTPHSPFFPPSGSHGFPQSSVVSLPPRPPPSQPFPFLFRVGGGSRPRGAARLGRPLPQCPWAGGEHGH